MMKFILMIMLLAIPVLSDNWVPVGVNTNTLVCKPMDMSDWGSNVWDQLPSQEWVTNFIDDTTITPPAPSGGPSIGGNEWVPIYVNTNTWQCKPYGTWGTNFWDELASYQFVRNAAIPPTPPTVPNSTNSLPSYYEEALFWLSFTDDSLSPILYDNTGKGNSFTKSFVNTPFSFREPSNFGYALRFPIRNQTYIEAINAGIGNGLTEMTIVFWFAFYDGYDFSHGAYMYSTGETIDDSNTTKLYLSGSGFGTPSTPPTWNVTFNNQIGTFSWFDWSWHLFSASYRNNGGAANSEMKIRIDNVTFYNVSNKQPIVIDIHNWYFGDRGGTSLSGSPNILIDDFTVFPRWLSDAEVETIRTSLGGRSEAAPW